jgi:hypothetical protein
MTGWSNNGYGYDSTHRLVTGPHYSYLFDADDNRIEKQGNLHTFYMVDDVNPSGYAQVLEEFNDEKGQPELSRVYN